MPEYKCRCDTLLLAWHVWRWPSGYLIQHCDQPGSCSRAHFWAFSSADLLAFYGYSRDGLGCDVLSPAGKLILPGGCAARRFANSRLSSVEQQAERPRPTGWGDARPVWSHVRTGSVVAMRDPGSIGARLRR